MIDETPGLSTSLVQDTLPAGALPNTTDRLRSRSTAMSPVRTWQSRNGLLVLVFPLILVVLVTILSAARLSGTSVGVLAEVGARGPDPSLVLGSPRLVRSDEWNIATPLLVGQSHHDYSVLTSDGLGAHDLRTILDVPTRDWSTVFRPWNLPPLFLDLQHGFAARWWVMSLVLVLGMYLLLLALTDRILIATIFSLALLFSPFFWWWYEPASLDSVGMGTLALGAFLYATKATKPLSRAGWLILATYAAVGFAMILYPPFQIPTAIVLLFTGAGALSLAGARGGFPWRRALANSVYVAVPAIIVLGLFYFDVRHALSALNGTIYPGHRRRSGGVYAGLQLVSAPFGLDIARNGDTLIRSATNNQSELSSFLLLGPFLLFQLCWLWSKSRALISRRSRSLLVATGLSLLILLAWYLFGLPAVLASITFLDHVEPRRAVIGIGLASVIFAAVFCARDGAPQQSPGLLQHGTTPNADGRWSSYGVGLCVVFALGLYLAAGWRIRSDLPSLKLSIFEIAIGSGAAAVVIGLICARQAVLGGIALVLFGAIVSLAADPLYTGLGPLTSPLTASFARLGALAPDANRRVWLSFEPFNDALVASGVPTLNAINPYPVRSAWHDLDPNMPASVWNRYAIVGFLPAKPGTPTTAFLVGETEVLVKIDPCGETSARLRVGFVVSQYPLTNSCLHLVANFSNQLVSGQGPSYGPFLPVVFPGPYVYQRSG